LNWLDLLILAVVGLGVLSGLRLGFGRMCARLVSLLAAVAAAALAAAPLAAWSDGRWGLVTRLTPTISRYVQLPRALANLDLATAPLAGLLDQLHLPNMVPSLMPVLERWLNEGVAPALARGTTTVGAFIHDTMARMLLMAAVFFAVFLIVKWAIGLAITAALAPLRVGGVDRLLGAAFGGAEKALFLGITLGVLSPWFGTPALGFMNTAVAGSRYARALIDTFLRYYPLLARVI